MKKAKKILSVFLALLMIATIIPMSSITAYAASLVWPVPGHENSIYQPFHSGHAGIDISDGSIAGADVVAAMGGTVSNIYNCVQNHENHDEGAKHCGGFGTGVIIHGDDGRWYQYAHMQAYSIPSNVYVGAYVPAGAKVGKVGNTGNSTGNHLHFQINTINAWNGPVNPQAESYSGQQISYFTSVWADNITENDATIHATIYGTNLSTCGFYIGKSESAMEKRTETVNGYVENIWYTLSSDYGTLQPGTTYYYKFFVTVGGTEYCSDVKTFKTSGNTYTISYNANGGTGAPASQTKAQGTTLIITETVPTRTGYTFLGWSTSSTATTATYCAGSHFTTDANTTLYAVWRADEYSGICGENNLTWHLNVGTGVLTIFGNGAMDNYTSSSKQPWYDYRDLIKTVVINNGVTKIGRYAFAECENITSITISNSVITIEDNVFRGCAKLTEITIPNSVTKIGKYAFFNCTSLADITILDSPSSIGNSAFAYCDNIKNISFGKNITYIDCMYISETSPYYNDKSNWKNGALYIDSYLIVVDKDNIEGDFFVPEGTDIIAGGAFINCEKLTKVVVPESVKSIGIMAFAQCPHLETVIIPNSVTVIETRMFYLSTSLTEIIIPNGVTTIGEWAFYDCDSLTDVTIFNSVTKIEPGAFQYCSGLSSGLTVVYYIGTKQQWDMIRCIH